MNNPSFPLLYAKPKNLKFFVALTLAIWLFSLFTFSFSFPSRCRPPSFGYSGLYWFRPSLEFFSQGTMASADFCAFSTAFRLWLRLSARSAQTSPGTTRFFPSIYLPNLPHAIPCSYWASTCLAALPSHIAFYAVSVRQARGLPVVSLFPHPASFRFRLTADTLAFGYLLPAAGRIRVFHPLETCAAGRTEKEPPGNDRSLTVNGCGIILTRAQLCRPSSEAGGLGMVGRAAGRSPDLVICCAPCGTPAPAQPRTRPPAGATAPAAICRRSAAE